LEAMEGADVFVFPSRNEGFGVALVEALACGRQIVASDCPHGPTEILESGRLGQLVPPEDAAALASAICRSLSGEVVFDPDALRGRAAAFTSDASVNSYLVLLKSLMHTG
jgi:glycosyltransferase involved in cell wall biosynthesis